MESNTTIRRKQEPKTATFASILRLFNYSYSYSLLRFQGLFFLEKRPDAQEGEAQEDNCACLKEAERNKHLLWGSCCELPQ
eukprot:291654-Amphidinium_carterae.1